MGWEEREPADLFQENWEILNYKPQTQNSKY